MSQAGMTGGWSKHGGGRHSIIKRKIKGPWACQSCGSKQPPEMSPFLFEFMDEEWIRVCADCASDGCETLWKKRQ